MPGFKTHISASTIVGIGYGAAGHFVWNVPPTTAMLAGGLFSIGGILPDVDSDRGHTVREVMGFAAAVVPLLLMDRFREAGLQHDALVLAGGCLYIIIRFGIGEILRRYTVHRGMWHSIPAALIAGLATSFICSSDVPLYRFYKVGAVVFGYLLHLTLDEIWSIQWYRGRLRFKKSFGTAMKMWGNDFVANTTVFAKLAVLTYFVVMDGSLLVPNASPLETPQPVTTQPVVPFDATSDPPIYAPPALELRPLEGTRPEITTRPASDFEYEYR